MTSLTKFQVMQVKPKLQRQQSAGINGPESDISPEHGFDLVTAFLEIVAKDG